MKVKQVVSVKFDGVYSSYGSLDITDADGDEVTIRLSDDQYIELYESIARKVTRIKEDRISELEKELEKKKEENEVE
jgi:hypothetical protein